VPLDEHMPAVVEAEVQASSGSGATGLQYGDYDGLTLPRNGAVWAPTIVCYGAHGQCCICLEPYLGACKGVVICSLGKHSVCTSCLQMFMGAVNAATSSSQLRLASACPTCRSPLATTLVLPSPAIPGDREATT
jgi:hypothetical protein